MAVSDPFSKILISEGIVSAEQLAEAARVSGTSGTKVHDEVIKLGYRFLMPKPARSNAVLEKGLKLTGRK